jgi:hypothetical protein
MSDARVVRLTVRANRPGVVDAVLRYASEKSGGYEHLHLHNISRVEPYRLSITVAEDHVDAIQAYAKAYSDELDQRDWPSKS